uniref:Protein extra-macrochaetae n=1 Tax=Bactrocera dorsalis TaxID=27457 RepID=A0A034VGX2_BACDO
MKSLTAVCQTGASMPPMNPNGRIARHAPQRGDGENAEMKMYLSKLKDLVPFMPKNRKLSKLEIIQHVIDYICDLQTELEAHPEIANFDAASALNMSDDSAHNTSMNSEENEQRLAERLSGADNSYSSISLQQQQQNSALNSATSSPALRQPLADRQAPNTILPGTNMTAAAAHTTMALHMQQQLQLQQQQWEAQMLQQQQQQAQQQQQQAQQSQQQPAQQQQQHQQLPSGETVSC